MLPVSLDVVDHSRCVQENLGKRESMVTASHHFSKMAVKCQPLVGSHRADKMLDAIHSLLVHKHRLLLFHYQHICQNISRKNFQLVLSMLASSAVSF